MRAAVATIVAVGLVGLAGCARIDESGDREPPSPASPSPTAFAGPANPDHLQWALEGLPEEFHEAGQCGMDPLPPPVLQRVDLTGEGTAAEWYEPLEPPDGEGIRATDTWDANFCLPMTADRTEVRVRLDVVGFPDPEAASAWLAELAEAAEAGLQIQGESGTGEASGDCVAEVSPAGSALAGDGGLDLLIDDPCSFGERYDFYFEWDQRVDSVAAAGPYVVFGYVREAAIPQRHAMELPGEGFIEVHTSQTIVHLEAEQATLIAGLTQRLRVAY